jgi:hypothetical protein
MEDLVDFINDDALGEKRCAPDTNVERIGGLLLNFRAQIAEVIRSR